ncbi:probable malonyl-CoA-acyl carrier protein transacylase, mitochondrial isoform X2 [Ooceraea biroi]|uniref:probable malonyl-CoA-acyl carrier protein transacylase, mitochondrial isoform X2 n=1 Tax=Ooceraea biroi TaxID=2015173 RepID=UPI0005B88BA5|nr:probable malonyl-CoA-acyl carrier protein transacylase, mitochondrial isoform X2 [Ooceraea biroi]
MFPTVAMFQRALSVRTVSCALSYRFLDRVNGFADSASTKETSEIGASATDESRNEPTTDPDDPDAPSGRENVAQMLAEAATYSDAKDTSWATSPYPAGAPTSVGEEEAVRPKIDPLDTCVLLFPGQGTLKVGAVQKYLRFPQAKELFEIANEILNYDLLKICLKGPQQKLDQTRFNQPATVVSSLAALEKLREERPKDGIRLVAVRGAGMQYASERSRQGMLSLFCTPAAQLTKACEDAMKWAQDNGVEDPVCQVAVYLYTQARIVAGHTEALNYIEKNAEKYGLTRLTRLPVSGAFHTSLMEPALKSFGKMLHEVQLDKPRCQVYSNFKGHQHSNEKLIRKYLLRQIVSPVKWEQCMQYVYCRKAGMAYPRTFDVGSGGRMSTILKLINAKAHEHCISV